MSASPFTTIAVAAAMVSTAFISATPVQAEPAGAFIAAGVVGAVLGAGLASRLNDEDRWVEGAPVHWYGVPGYQRAQVLPARVYMPGAGPGRHVVCGWQERYDRHEHYVGSRRICWVEAR